MIVALNSLLLLDGRDAQRALFEVIARHLAPDGRAVIDVWLPAPMISRLYDGRLVLDWVRRRRDAASHVAKSTSARYESGARIAHVTTLFDAWRDGDAPDRTMRREDTITFVSRGRAAAFRDGRRAESWRPSPAITKWATSPTDSDRVVMVCRRRTG